MNSPEPCLPVTPLEMSPIPSATTPFWMARSFLRQQWQRWMTLFIQTQELHVWQRTDRAGCTYWQAYDPVTGQSTTGSEADLRAWIEQLHYLKR